MRASRSLAEEIVEIILVYRDPNPERAARATLMRSTKSRRRSRVCSVREVGQCKARRREARGNRKK